jgi:L-malate glycosyltransferase
MIILHCCASYPPYADGIAVQVSQVSQQLVKLGHQVTVATASHPDRPRETVLEGVRVLSFDVSGNAVHGMRGEIAAYREFTSQADFDVLVPFAAQIWSFDAIADLLPGLGCRKVFAPVGFSGLRHPQYVDYFKRMPGWLANFEALIFHSEDYQDIRFAQKLGLPNCHVVHHAACAQEFARKPDLDLKGLLGIESSRMVALLGNHTGLKGHYEALRMFAKADIEDCTLLIMGHELGCETRSAKNLARNLLRFGSCSPWGPGCRHVCEDSASAFEKSARARQRGLHVKLAALTRAQVVAALFEADLLLHPSNIEACPPIVLFEAMAACTPFLVSDVGGAGAFVRRYELGGLLPTRIDRQGRSHVHIGQGARLLTESLGNAAWLADQAQKGHRLWREKHTWAHIGKRYAAIYAAEQTSQP